MIQDSANPDFQYMGEVPPVDAAPPELAYSYSGSTIERWLAQNRSTHGGDHPECVEYVLRYLRATHVPAAQAGGHHLIVFWIGDAPPHEAGAAPASTSYLNSRLAGGNVHGLDWEGELAYIAPTGTTIYTALCGQDARAANCWVTMSRNTGGISVSLDNIDNLANTRIAVVKRETGQLDEFAKEVRDGGADSEMEEILVDLGATCYDE